MYCIVINNAVLFLDNLVEKRTVRRFETKEEAEEIAKELRKVEDFHSVTIEEINV